MLHFSRDLREPCRQRAAMSCEQTIRVQGRRLTAAELRELQERIDGHPEWSRHQVAKDLCQRWQWQTPLGRWKTFAARSLLLKLEARHGLRLPPVRTNLRRPPWGLRRGGEAATTAEPITDALERLRPLQWCLAGHGTAERARALAYLRTYHYLGCDRPVGTNLVYLVRDQWGRDLAVHLIGAAAWQCAARDRAIGWDAAGRASGLTRIANHSRFLILPWVTVPQLASHLLGGLTRRVACDWQAQHGWRLELLETYVETGRFRGTAYRAANWQPVGLTTGRTRQEKQHQAQAPRKAVWIFPLHPRFRQRLGATLAVGGGA